MDPRVAKTIFMAACSLPFGLAFGATDATINPFIPHIYISGYAGVAGDDGDVLGRADILAPIYLQSDRNFFAYAQGRLSNAASADGTDNPWQGTAGLGYRQILNIKDNQQLFGAYVLADANGSPLGNTFWDISPGIETLGNLIDARINGYFPVSDSEKAGQVFDHYAGHDAFDRVYEEEEGIGADAEIGVHVLSINHMPLKVFLDGYYFNTDDENITGIGGRVTFQPTRYLTLQVKDSYDNDQHNVFLVGAQVYLNGLAPSNFNAHVDDQGIQQRLYDPIERNFGTIGVGNSAPITKEDKGTVLAQQHIEFVEPGIVAPTAGDGQPQGDGTFEDPYIYTDTDMQSILDTSHDMFPDYSYIYFAPGSYTIGTANLWGGQQIWGRTDGWVNPADPSQVVFYGSMTAGINDASGDYEFHNFTLFNYGEFTDNTSPGIAASVGIDITNNSSVILDNIIVGEIPNDLEYDSNAFQIGVYAENSTIAIYNSTINGFNSENIVPPSSSADGNTPPFAAGVYTYDSKILGIYNSDFNAVGKHVVEDEMAQQDDVSYSVYGLFAENDYNQTIGNIVNSNFYAESDYDVSGVLPTLTSAYGFGVSAAQDVTISGIYNSTFTGIGYNDEAFGFAIEAGRDATVGDIINSDFYGQGSGAILDAGGSSVGIGFYAEVNRNLTMKDIKGSSFEGIDYEGAFAAGFYADVGQNFVLDDIIKSSFTGSLYTNNNENADQGLVFPGGYGFYADVVQDFNLDKIVESDFTGNSDFGGEVGIGFNAEVGQNFVLNNIIESNFKGDGSIEGIGFKAEVDQDFTLVDIVKSTFQGNGSEGDGFFTNVGRNFSLNNIIKSNFTGLSDEVGVGFNANVGQDMDIGNIEESNFTGKGSGVYAAGFYATVDGNFTLNNIIDSIFSVSGEGYDSPSFGFEAEVGGSFVLNNIIDSNFMAVNNVSQAFGFSVDAAANITINNITGSTFTGLSNYSDAYGFYANADGNITIGDIDDSFFISNDTGINLEATAVFVDGSQYTDGYDLYLELVKDNSFNNLVNNVCVNGNCDLL